MRFEDLPPLPTTTVMLRGQALPCTVPTQAVEMLIGEKLPIRVAAGRTQELNAEFRARQLSDFELQQAALAGFALGLGDPPREADPDAAWQAYARLVCSKLAPHEIRGVIDAARAATGDAEATRLLGDAGTGTPGN